MRKGPDSIQQWVDTIAPAHTTQAPLSIYSPNTKTAQKFLSRDLSFQSDDGSHCSSLESVLEFRKPDPEEVLLGLGFGPPRNTQYASRIPERFLQPSKVRIFPDIFFSTSFV